MDPHHRKVDLQAPADLVYLHNNIKAVAQQKLDLAIPPQGEDAFRNQVQELVQEYITKTLTLALPSIAINGLDAPAAASSLIIGPSTSADNHPCPGSGSSPSTPSENDSNYEPYDSRLAAKLRELYAQLEYESTRVAELRREAPGAAARAYMERLEAEMKEEEEGYRIRIEGEEAGKMMGGAGSSGKKEEELLLGPIAATTIKMERLEEMERMWERGTEGLVRLEKVTEVLATLERARKALEVVQDM